WRARAAACRRGADAVWGGCKLLVEPPGVRSLYARPADGYVRTVARSSLLPVRGPATGSADAASERRHCSSQALPPVYAGRGRIGKPLAGRSLDVYARCIARSHGFDVLPRGVFVVSDTARRTDCGHPA